jgi:3-hydroxyisobutyrate dehydrogenase-like beta-hydroxyacid dehydrogenase
MSSNDGTAVTVLGLGDMGGALAAALVDAGHRTTVWNRTPGRDAALVAAGASSAPTIREAVTASPVVIACLLDHASVHETLDPVATDLEGRALVNLTTTRPSHSRELAGWAADAGVDYLDGGIMAVPPMIGTSSASILYSGSETVFRTSRPILDAWGTSTYFGEDAGLASLYDLAILSGMYVMFAGFFHGAAMVATEGVSAGEFAAWATPFLAAMTGELEGLAKVVDGGDYTVPGQQSLEFSDLDDLLRASAEQGVGTEAVAMVQGLIRRQIDAGHGDEAFARIYEGIRHPTGDRGTA